MSSVKANLPKPIYGLVQPKTSQTQHVSFGASWPAPCRVLLGLKGVSGMGREIAAEATIKETDKDGFSFTIAQGPRSRASISYMAIPSHDGDIQCSEPAVTSALSGQQTTTGNLTSRHTVTFPHGYTAKPKVLVWLLGVPDILSSSQRIEVSAEDVTCRGFSLVFDYHSHNAGWGGKELWGYEYRAGWVAFGADRDDISSHVITAMDDKADCQFYGLASVTMGDPWRGGLMEVGVDLDPQGRVTTTGAGKVVHVTYVGISLNYLASI